MGNPEDYSVPNLDELRKDPQPLSPDAAEQAGGERVGQALAGAHDRLMSLPGVVMVGEGLDAIGNRAILIGVKRADQLAALPARVGEIPVVAQVLGEVDILPAARRK